MITKAELEKLASKDPKVKYGFAKELLHTAIEDPVSLYPYFNYWTTLVSGTNNILKWTAIDIIGYLSAVDTDDKTDEIIDLFIGILHCGALISCNHVIFSLGLIAKNKEKHRKKIFDEFFLIPEDIFETEECKNIATGKVLEAIKPFLEELKNEEAAVTFIGNAAGSSRNSTRKKAEQLLQQLEKINQ
ncbi:MAG: hypothetical protein LBQ60_13010 [Bacteroidales bacterium]|jgi:hypothetical protein|nr:hypothetical protein [Bacteroidales bacterium]